MADIVFLEGMQFFAFHGANPEERVLGRRFVVDVALEQPARGPAAPDDVESTINYSAAYKKVREVVEGPPRHLIETVAEEIAACLLADFARADAVTVTVRKPDPPIKGSILAAAGVTIRRTREGTG